MNSPRRVNLKSTARVADGAPALLTENEAARFLGFSPRTLQTWRVRGTGPSFIRVSKRCVRYTMDDLEAWITENRRSSTADDGTNHSTPKTE